LTWFWKCEFDGHNPKCNRCREANQDCGEKRLPKETLEDRRIDEEEDEFFELLIQYAKRLRNTGKTLDEIRQIMMPEVTESTQPVSNQIEQINPPDPFDYQSFSNATPILTNPPNNSFQRQYDSQSQPVHSYDGTNILKETNHQSFFHATPISTNPPNTLFPGQYYAQSEANQSYSGADIPNQPRHNPSQSNAAQFPFNNVFLHDIHSNIDSTALGAHLQAHLPNASGNTIESSQLGAGGMEHPYYGNPETYPQ
jgi:hypothetical protein